ncbi:hypothetical protein [Azospira restricta]|uniref:Uncharacterized protein n=1 Tax=Azospira restricta TaxID=404405 RepID=A0A974PYN6_9RHOO|nr:hypothetical protein [Azospira restricta]QRJ63589.1 hypothetical protein IWH25_17915 [Azospira restricta]
MLKPAAAIAGQVVLYGAFAAFIGYFATDPVYRQIPDDVAVIKVSFSHLGDRECRKRTPEELAKLPPNMRAPMDCPRERSDIRFELDIDDQNVVRHVLHPTGLYKDGISTMYRRLEVKAGTHKFSVRMQDNVKQEGWKFIKEETVELKPAQAMVIDFHPDKGGLFFK